MFEASINQLSSLIGDNKLLPVKSLDKNDSYKVLNIVIEHSVRRFFWHQPKYEPVKYSLHDLISPPNETFEKEIEVKTHEKLIECNITKTFTAHGKAGGELLHLVEASISADDTVTVDAKFGYINKTTVDMISLEKHLQTIRIDLNSDVLTSLTLNPSSKLCVVVETLTLDADATLTSTSTIMEQEKLDLEGKVTPKEDENASRTNTMSLTVPAGSTLLYDIAELFVDEQGKVSVNSQSRLGIQIEYNDVSLKEQYGLLFNSGQEKELLHCILTSFDMPSTAKYINRMLKNKQASREKITVYKSIFDITGFHSKKDSDDDLELAADNAVYEQMLSYYECVLQLSDVNLTLIHAIYKDQLEDLLSLLTGIVTPGARQPLNSDPVISRLSAKSLAWINSLGIKFMEGSSEGHGQGLTLDHTYSKDTCQDLRCNVHDIIHSALHVIYVIHNLALKSKSMCTII